MDNRLLEEKALARRWIGCWLVAGLVLALIVLIVGVPIADFFTCNCAPKVWWSRTGAFFDALQTRPQAVVGSYTRWFQKGMFERGYPPPLFLVAGAVVLLSLIEGVRWCPYDFVDSLHGGARFSRMSDLKRWARKRVVPYFLFLKARRAQPLLDKSGVILGRFEKKYVRCADTLSTLVLAAPGSGKTAGIMVPTLVADGMEDWSVFCFDIKGELYEQTAGHRAKFGPVFRFEPKGRTGARWNPLSPEKSLPKSRNGRTVMDLIATLEAALKPLFGEGAMVARMGLMAAIRMHSDWRKRVLAEPGMLGPVLVDMAAYRAAMNGTVLELAVETNEVLADVETYLWRLATAFVPDRPGAGDGKHFSDTGRAALFGMLGLTIFRSLRLGLEPNIGRLVDWWSDALGDQAGKKAAEGEEEKEDADAIAEALDTWIQECDAHGYPLRYKQELVALRNKPSRERGSVVSTADVALSIFKIATVRDRTSTSDFALDEIRGLKGADGKSYPVTIYVVVSLEDIASMAPILMMFTEALQNRLISQPAKVAKNARKVLFALDEFAQIPKMQCLLSGPAVGRGQRVANLLMAQSEGQISATYTADGLKALNDTTEWKILFALTDSATAEKYSKTMGNRTVQQRSVGRKGFDLQGAIGGLFSKNGGAPESGPSFNDSLTGKPLLSPDELMTTDDNAKVRPDEHIVLARGKFSRPILVKTPYWFEDKVMAARCEIPAPAEADAHGFCGALAHLAAPADEMDQPESDPAHDASSPASALQGADALLVATMRGGIETGAQGRQVA